MQKTKNKVESLQVKTNVLPLLMQTKNSTWSICCNIFRLSRVVGGVCFYFVLFCVSAFTKWDKCIFCIYSPGSIARGLCLNVIRPPSCYMHCSSGYWPFDPKVAQYSDVNRLPFTSPFCIVLEMWDSPRLTGGTTSFLFLLMLFLKSLLHRVLNMNILFYKMHLSGTNKGL